MTHLEKEKKKKFKLTKEAVWKAIMIVSSILLIFSSLAPLLLR
jgi:hypothetical protein